MYKKIALLALIIGLSGLFFSIYRWSNLSKDYIAFYFVIYDLFGSVNLKLFVMEDYMHYTGNSGRSYNLLTITFYGLFFVSGLLYLFSKGKILNLIRFLFAVFFLSKAVHFLYSIFYSLFLTDYSKMIGMNYFHLFLHYLFLIIWIYVSYRILIYFNNQRPVQLRENESVNEKPIVEENIRLSAREILERQNHSSSKGRLRFVTASLSRRFFHLCVDILVTILIFSFVISSIAHLPSKNEFALKMTDFFNSEFAIYVLFFCWRFFYYFTYETLFQITPAKILTESRVIDVESKQMTSGQIAVRTISRFIPFEAFTFFGTKGFHDSFSNTTVVPENKTSWVGRTTIFSLLILFIAIIYLMIV